MMVIQRKSPFLSKNEAGELAVPVVDDALYLSHFTWRPVMHKGRLAAFTTEVIPSDSLAFYITLNMEVIKGELETQQ